MTLLPQQMLPITTPLAVQRNGVIFIDKQWWLLLYGLCIQVLGSGTAQGLPSDALQDLAGADTDAADSDAVVLRRPISNLAVELEDPLKISSSDLPDIAMSLLLAQDDLLPDPAPLAPAVSVITPTGSVFTYTAPYAGSVVVTGGTVSAISIARQGTSVSTGLTVGVFPVSRYDQVKVTYSGTPTMSFIPSSPQ
jgi:hypothetical protein